MLIITKVKIAKKLFNLLTTISANKLLLLNVRFYLNCIVEQMNFINKEFQGNNYIPLSSKGTVTTFLGKSSALENEYSRLFLIVIPLCGVNKHSFA